MSDLMAPAPQMTLLVVDDNPTNRRVLEVWLSKVGYTVKTAQHGKEALAMLEGGCEVDLILMDCEMPVMDGLQATSEIRVLEAEAGRRRVPIIAVTATHADTMRLACLNAGMDDFHAKPVNFPVLLGRIRELLLPGAAAGTQAVA